MYLVLYLWSFLFCFFFFKQKTAYEMRISDWSSDVCSSDLPRRCADRDIAPRRLWFALGMGAEGWRTPDGAAPDRRRHDPAAGAGDAFRRVMGRRIRLCPAPHSRFRALDRRDRKSVV